VLDYRAPEGGCWLGAFVEVPLGPRKVLGVVWGDGQGRLRPREDPGGEPGAGRAADARGDAGVPDQGRGLHADADEPDAAAGDAGAGLGDPPSMRKVYRLGQQGSPTG
jgi:primosomal protein N' (replication factor Y)